jgi:hypothetical protein
MPTFIKPGFWNIKRKQLAGELNLDQLVESKIPAAKYKVFTALLTQSGGDNSQVLSFDNIPGGPDFTIGVTYQINDNTAGLDVTNIGAPNNEIGTYFVATGIRPANWGEGALIYNTGAPVATVLENTIGNIWFRYGNTGIYSVNSDHLFKEDKTTIDIDNFGRNAINLDNVPNYIANETIINAQSEFYIFTTRPPDYRDEVLQKNRLEIRVYN